MDEHTALDARFFALAKRLATCMVQQVSTEKPSSSSLLKAREGAFEGMSADEATLAREAALGILTRDVNGAGQPLVPRIRVAPRLSMS